MSFAMAVDEGSCQTPLLLTRSIKSDHELLGREWAAKNSDIEGRRDPSGWEHTRRIVGHGSGHGLVTVLVPITRRSLSLLVANLSMQKRCKFMDLPYLIVKHGNPSECS